MRWKQWQLIVLLVGRGFEVEEESYQVEELFQGIFSEKMMTLRDDCSWPIWAFCCFY